ncbi:hypothetical protein AAFN46_13825 [Pseudomonas sp. CAU 1711]|uniref:hypothetical protein n=1 Tax=Pseudomonas sp. CAU 1711 TaxID=3140356 RepID=UPI003260A558
MREAAGRGWIVTLGHCTVPFPSQEAADQFVARLRQRLAAPHQLPRRDQETMGQAQD